MDARPQSLKLWLPLIAIFGLARTILAADFETPNFVIHAPDARFAQQIGTAAERFRRELAIQWLGEELSPWREKCPITVRIEPYACGQTSFGFAVGVSRSDPTGWQMEVCGSPERILDSVLPHEITHTIFASHFGRPLPRWADEGACTTVEHESERSKNHQMLFQFFNERRTIPFNRMFTMKQYPQDIYPIYAQGYSVARFLIMQGGHRRFVDFVDEGLSTESRGQQTQAWDAVTKKYYGYQDLSELQIGWVKWIKEGCPQLERSAQADAVAAVLPQAERTQPPAESALSLNTVPQAPPIRVSASSSSSLDFYRNQAARVSSGPQMADADIANEGSGSESGGYRPGSTGDVSALPELLSAETVIGPPGSGIDERRIIRGQSPVSQSTSDRNTVWR